MKAQLDGPYRWQVARQELRAPTGITGQQGRFSDGLFQKLRAAYAFDPASGRFGDFDLLSNTQVSTMGAKVIGCIALAGGGMEALVAVQAGLPHRTVEAPEAAALSAGEGPSWRLHDCRHRLPQSGRVRAFQLSGRAACCQAQIAAANVRPPFGHPLGEPENTF